MRYSLYNLMQEQDGISIYNPNSVDWSAFDWSQGYYKHIMSKMDIIKPYMISYAYYNTTEYEDIIMLLNNIEDVFSLQPGTEIYIPILSALQNFILQNQK